MNAPPSTETLRVIARRLSRESRKQVPYDHVLAASQAEIPELSDSPNRSARMELLVLENHHSYWSFCKWNRNSHVYAAIAYGSGDAFRSAARHLDRICEHSGANRLDYFGDIDPKGLAIGCDVDQARQEQGLPPLQPALDHYRWLVQHGIRRPLAPATMKAMPEQERVKEWLGSELSAIIISLFDHGWWLPQEALGLEYLTTDQDGDSFRPPE